MSKFIQVVDNSEKAVYVNVDAITKIECSKNSLYGVLYLGKDDIVPISVSKFDDFIKELQSMI